MARARAINSIIFLINFFNTSTEASVAVDMVEGAECKRERGHRSFAGDETFPFFWKVKVL